MLTQWAGRRAAALTIILLWSLELCFDPGSHFYLTAAPPSPLGVIPIQLILQSSPPVALTILLDLLSFLC